MAAPAPLTLARQATQHEDDVYGVYSVAGPFDLAEGGKLGIQFKTVLGQLIRGVRVTNVREGGLIARWNEDKPDSKQIVAGVHIFEWNGKTGRARDLFGVIKDLPSDLRLNILTGPRHHMGIQQALERIFHTFDLDDSGELSLDEFSQVTSVVAMEIGEELDEDGVEVADANGDGTLSLEEFFEYTTSMFEPLNLPLDALAVVLEGLADRQEASLDPNAAALLRTRTPRTMGAFAKLQQMRGVPMEVEDASSDGSGDEA